MLWYDVINYNGEKGARKVSHLEAHSWAQFWDTEALLAFECTLPPIIQRSNPRYCMINTHGISSTLLFMGNIDPIIRLLFAEIDPLGIE